MSERGGAAAAPAVGAAWRHPARQASPRPRSRSSPRPRRYRSRSRSGVRHCSARRLHRSGSGERAELHERRPDGQRRHRHRDQGSHHRHLNLDRPGEERHFHRQRTEEGGGAGAACAAAAAAGAPAASSPRAFGIRGVLRRADMAAAAQEFETWVREVALLPHLSCDEREAEKLFLAFCLAWNLGTLPVEYYLGMGGGAAGSGGGDSGR